MIIIIRALSLKKKKKGQKEKKEGKKEEKKKGAMLLSLFPHMCFKVAPCSSYREACIFQ